MSDLLRAADHLDQLADALPEPIQQPWHHFADQVYVEHNGNDHVFAWADTNRTTSPAGNAETTALIAAAASPDAVRAQAALLRAHAALAAINAEPVPKRDHEIADRMRRREAATRTVNAAVTNLARHYTGSLT